MITTSLAEEIYIYGFQIEWEMMNDGLANIETVFSAVKVALASFLDSLSRS
jgi:hypothetical protein